MSLTWAALPACRNNGAIESDAVTNPRRLNNAFSSSSVSDEIGVCETMARPPEEGSYKVYRKMRPFQRCLAPATEAIGDSV